MVRNFTMFCHFLNITGNFFVDYKFTKKFTGTQHDYTVVQNCGGLADIQGPYLHLQLAINELKKLAENCGNDWNKSNCIYLTDQYEQSESDNEFEILKMCQHRTGHSSGENKVVAPNEKRPVTYNLGFKYIERNRYGYCMMLIKTTDGIIPNNYKGLCFIDEYEEVEWADVVIGSVWDIKKMVKICRQNYEYTPLGVLDLELK